MFLKNISLSLLFILSVGAIANAESNAGGRPIFGVPSEGPPNKADCLGGNCNSPLDIIELARGQQGQQPQQPEEPQQPSQDGWQDVGNGSDGGGQIEFPGEQPGRIDHDDGYDGGYDGDPGYGGGRPRPPQQGYWEYDTQRIYIGRSVQNERFPLRQLAGLDYNYRGWEVTAVRAMTRSNSPFQTTVQLFADGRLIAQQINPGRMINLFPRGAAVLDDNVRSLQMVVIGSTVIVDSIEIELRAYRN